MTATTQELQHALDTIRRRPAHRCWPATLDEVLANPIQSRLVRIEATLQRRRFKPYPFRNPPSKRPQTLAPMAIDHKRAAAGDIDD